MRKQVFSWLGKKFRALSDLAFQIVLTVFLRYMIIEDTSTFPPLCNWSRLA